MMEVRAYTVAHPSEVEDAEAVEGKQRVRLDGATLVHQHLQLPLDLCQLAAGIRTEGKGT
jgi:hypothetical protein